MAEYTNMVTVSSLAATLYLGGWTLGGLSGVPGLPFLWYMIKVGIFLFVFIWLRATLPRIRYDRLMRFGWQMLLPLAVLNLVVTSAIVTLAPTADQWWMSLTFNVVVIALGGIVYFARRARSIRGHPLLKEVGLVMPSSVHLVHLESVVSPIGDGSVATTGDAKSSAGIKTT